MGKVTKAAARFGPRYGMTLRRRWLRVYMKLKAKYRCPRCQVGVLRRVSVGVWECRKCGYKFAGGAFSPWTSKK